MPFLCSRLDAFGSIKSLAVAKWNSAGYVCQLSHYTRAVHTKHNVFSFWIRRKNAGNVSLGNLFINQRQNHGIVIVNIAPRAHTHLTVFVLVWVWKMLCGLVRYGCWWHGNTIICGSGFREIDSQISRYASKSLWSKRHSISCSLHAHSLVHNHHIKNHLVDGWRWVCPIRSSIYI